MRYEAVVTHIPVIKVPITPARAWTAKTSMGSSTRIETFNLVAKFEQNEATKPIRAAAGAPTKPAAGVIATKLRGTRHQISSYRTSRMKKKNIPSDGSGTETDDAPFTFETEIHDHPNDTTRAFQNEQKQLKNLRLQLTHPTLPAKLVLNAAKAAFKLAAKVDPALNPSHPTQSRIVPRMT
jgi:hypothetical protein